MTTVNLTELIAPGLSQSRSEVVVDAMTVGALVNGMPMVYSTPYMITVMEVTAENLTAARLPKGWVSVGTRVEVRHLKATPVGFTVTTTAEVIEVTAKEILYKVSAHDGVDLIGEGMHARGVVELSRFEQGMSRKAAKKPPQTRS
ncbi:MAG: thioesterase family protein [Gammaproteobacteria bacterium]